MPKAFSYLRFSTPEQAKGDSDRRQTELARNYAALHGLDLDESSYRDLGVSGFRGTNARTGALGQFLAAVDNGMVPVGAFLLVENLDRVSRQDPWDALPVFQQIINAGITIVTLQDGKSWSRDEMRANPYRLFESLLTMVRAHEESETKSRRLKASWAGKRAKATEKPITSRGPAWLKLEDGRWRVLEDRADVVRRIFSLALAGTGENSIATALNRDSIATWGDNGRAPAPMWRKSYVSKILTSPSVVGTYVPHVMSHEGGKKTRTAGAPITAYYPAIVSPETWAGVRIFKEVPNPQRGRHAAKPVQNVLGGLARCSACGAAMTRVYKGSAEKAGVPKLVCVAAKTGKGCAYAALPLDAVEDALRAGYSSIANGGPNAEYAEDARQAIAEAQARIDDIDALATEMLRTPGLAKRADAMARVKAMLDDKADLEEEIVRMGDLGQLLFGGAPAKRLADLAAALSSDPFDRTAVNLALRHIFSRAVVDVSAATIRLEWKSKEVTMLPVAVQSTHDRQSANAKRARRTSTGHFLRLVA